MLHSVFLTKTIPVADIAEVFFVICFVGSISEYSICWNSRLEDLFEKIVLETTGKQSYHIWLGCLFCEVLTIKAITIGGGGLWLWPPQVYKWRLCQAKTAGKPKYNSYEGPDSAIFSDLRLQKIASMPLHGISFSVLKLTPKLCPCVKVLPWKHISMLLFFLQLSE